MNDGSTDLKKLTNIKHCTVCLNIRVINDVRTAVKTFRAEQRYSVKEMDCLYILIFFRDHTHFSHMLTFTKSQLNRL